MTTLTPRTSSSPSRSEALVLRASAAAERTVQRRIQRRAHRDLIEGDPFESIRNRAAGHSLGVWPG